ncbi:MULTISPECIES: sulfite exporter TauE/SafE family protein [Achromobacter]|uniref:Probable membrane transporter protein n=1 Tax=Achromobacter spanius TaxID=217203 RepID=A0AAW3HYN2_9BURK|nr:MULTISPECIES: sulfite exporter TauE/SafE family protein [Achromobacter]KNE24585.1 hypothetical protein AFM18_25020 [Achromobacter spanius]MCD0500928.1 sulfite exporter TauE/SafE family protein [Achromobacter sp. MY14]
MELLSQLPWTLGGVPELALLGFAGLAFLGAGVVKGTLGVGLPLFAVPLLSLVLPPPTAISLLVVPVLISNLWQAIQADKPIMYAARFKWLSLSLLVSTVVSVRLSLALPTDLLSLLVAASVICAVVLMMYKPEGAIPRKKELPLGVAVGILAGMMGGLSSMTGPFIITYLLALKLPRDEFVGSISIIYLFGMIPLYLALAYYGRLGLVETSMSMLAIVPMALGMFIGRRMRTFLSEEAFRRVLLGFLASVAVLLVSKGA